MGNHRPLPIHLGTEFTVAQALASGVSAKRLRGSDLSNPFRGVRTVIRTPVNDDRPDPYERQRKARVAKARQYLPRLRPWQFFSHDTAVSVYGGPLPLAFDESGAVSDGAELDLHVSVLGTGAVPRIRGVVGHRAQPTMTTVRMWNGLPVSSPATTWASLGMLPLTDLVALGDHFCRVWRSGVGRPHVGRPPLATIDGVLEALSSGRRVGAGRLREAASLIREDCWSPRECAVRLTLVLAGLPEPELNVDVRNESGRFLGCVDMLYRSHKVVIEYLGMLHDASWARDVERLAALRAAGYVVIEVTAPLLANPAELVARVRRALGV